MHGCGGGVRGCGGHAWLQGGMHGCGVVCMVAWEGDMNGCGGAYMVAGGACMVAGEHA